MNEAELLFTDLLKCSRMSLVLNAHKRLDKKSSVFVSSVLKRRLRGEPIQYILGKTEFMGLEFKVSPDVLIPRQETEILVEAALKYSLGVLRTASSVNIIDIGTGSGCIAIALAKFLPNARVTTTDVSEKALAVARDNAKLNSVSEKVTFIKSDLFSQCAVRSAQYDMIVSNPPYISSAEIRNLQPEVQYEPRLALIAGKDGLDFYRRLIAQAGRYLKRNGFLIMEMGYNQRVAIEYIFQNYKYFEIIEVIKDYNNIERVIVAQLVK